MLDPQFRRAWTEPPWPKRRMHRPRQGDAHRQYQQSIEAPHRTRGTDLPQKELREHLFAR
jgi:hypothetical protein